MKTESARLLFLGTGASMGVPVIGCPCAVCQSKSPYNKRLRPSVLLEVGDKKILVDCGPDFREQALRIKLDKLDGVIFTHAHNDHTAGIDDLRMLVMKNDKPLPCLLSQETADDIKRRFYYLFNSEIKPTSGQFLTRFDMQILDQEYGETIFQGINIRHISYWQMGMLVNGFRIGNLAYISDVRDYPSTIFEALEGIDTLVLSALRMEPSKMHLSVDEAIELAHRIGAKQTFFMHIAHELDHDKLNEYLPENIQMAYDGLELQFLAEIR